MKKIEIPEADKIELKRWDAVIEASPHEFHTFEWLKSVEMDYDIYLTYTNSIYPISLLNVKEDWHVLDHGCRYGRDLNILRKGYGANAIGIDLQRYNNDMILADGRFLCFKDNSFDAVTSIITLSLIKEEELVLREIKKVLKYNGKVLLVVLNNSLSNLKYKIFKPKVYKKFYNVNDILSLLESLDFGVEVVYFANISFPLLNRLPKFYKIIFKYENKLSKMWIARWIARRIVVIAKANK